MSDHDNKRKRSQEDPLVDLLKISLALKHFKAFKQELGDIQETEEQLRSTSGLDDVLAKKPVRCIFLVFHAIT
jgi:hypothetical protein